MSKIHSAINAAMADIARIGIAKVNKNTTQGYYFRGVEDAMNTLSPILVNNGITVAARYSDLAIGALQREGKAPLRIVTIKGTFAFSADDDSSITCEAYGEAMDSGDKAVIKAQSIAFRTALFQLFVVPTMSMDTELDHDGEDNSPAAKRDEWLRAQKQNIAEAANVKSLKSVMDYALGVARENKDQDAEDQLLAASEAKIATAKQKHGAAA